MAYVRSKGYQPVLGTVFPLDHWINRPSILALLVRWLAVPGGIIIMHDGNSRGHTTAQVLDRVLPLLIKAGYKFEALATGTPKQALEPTIVAITIRAARAWPHSPSTFSDEDQPLAAVTKLVMVAAQSSP